MRPEDSINLADSFQRKLFLERLESASKRSDSGDLGLRQQEFLWQMLSVKNLVEAGLPARVTGKQMNYLKSIAEG